MGKFTEYNVPLKSLAPGVHEFEYHLEQPFFNNIEDDEIHGADLDVKLTVDYRNDSYRLHFHIEGTATLICDRCLDNLDIPVDTDYEITVEYGDEYGGDDEHMILPDSDPSLNVAYIIRDTVRLAIPMKHVHPAGKCNRQMSNALRKHRATSSADPDAELEETLIDEMESMPDNDGATDPRWDALKGLGSGSDE